MVKSSVFQNVFLGMAAGAAASGRGLDEARRVGAEIIASRRGLVPVGSVPVGGRIWWTWAGSRGMGGRVCGVRYPVGAWRCGVCGVVWCGAWCYLRVVWWRWLVWWCVFGVTWLTLATKLAMQKHPISVLYFCWLANPFTARNR